MIAQGSGTGEGGGEDSDGLPSYHSDGLLDFLNEDKPLTRKSAASVLALAPISAKAAGQNVSDSAMAGITELIKEGSPFRDDAGLATSENAREVSLPAKLHIALSQVIDTGEALDFSSLMPRLPRSEATNSAVSDAQWIGRALSGAATGLAAKGETVVGFTEKTQKSFVNLEKALGNQNATQAAGAIEQLVADKTTPTPLVQTDIEANGSEFGDIMDLINGAEALIST